MANFYNPYQFVPMEKPGAAQQHLAMPRKAFEALAKGESSGPRWQHVTHERYVPGTHSGRLMVTLETVTPTVIGAEQTRARPDDYSTVAPYLVDGKPAFPGSSLRGLVGSVMEAASGGPLRVLEDRTYSYRRKMEESLSAIGMMVEEKDGWTLLPMCLPSLESKDGGQSYDVAAGFRKLFPKPQFKVFFGDEEMIRKDTFASRTSLDLSQAVPMPVKQLAWNGSAVLADGSLHIKMSRKGDKRFAVSQELRHEDSPRPGLIRVLGCWGDRKADMPRSKSHELWIPLPDPSARPVPVLPRVIERFYQLADERTADDPRLPFEPRDTRPAPDDRGDGRKFRLRTGDLVFFTVDPSGKMVTAISLSSIWRGRVENSATKEAASAFSFFRGIDEELLPFQKGRKTVSVVEQALGFVEETPKREDGEREGPSALALASRISFSDALPEEGDTDLLEDEVRLKILGSPKLPCPTLYFQKRIGGGYIAKPTLDPAQHAPQGRKWYLHAKPAPGKPQWETEKPRDNAKQKNVARPIRAGKRFVFHVDFENLSDEELGLLLFALEPDEKFYHKVGMGRPLGLGSVKLRVAAWFGIDRARRYTLDGLRVGRYTSGEWTDAGRGLRDLGKWPKAYSAEKSAPERPGVLQFARDAVLKSGLINGTARAALAILGDFASAPEAGMVRYPTNVDQRDKESEHFKWFQFNDGHRERGAGMSPSHQFLRTLKGARVLPTLEELDWDKPR